MDWFAGIFQHLSEAVDIGVMAWTPILYLKSFVMDSVQVGKAVFVKESHTGNQIEWNC